MNMATSANLSLTLNISLISEIDKRRGQTSRSEFVRQVLESAFGKKKKEAT